MILDVFVPGIPRPKGSMNAGIARGGRAYVYHADSTMKPWADSITAIVNTKLNETIGSRRPAFEGPVRCNVQFVYEDLKSDPTRYWKWTAPDGDKLERAVWDALTKAKVWEDDARVVDWAGSKVYMNALPMSQAGVYIVVSEALPTLF